MKLCQRKKRMFYLFLKGKDTKYFISYPTFAMRRYSYPSVVFHVNWEFYRRGKKQKNSHPSILFLSQTPTHKPTGAQ